MGPSRPLSNAILHRVYLLGYGGWVMPRRLRRILGGTQIHRAWFLGATGHFSQNGIRFGLARLYRDCTDTEVRS